VSAFRFRDIAVKLTNVLETELLGSIQESYGHGAARRFNIRYCALRIFSSRALSANLTSGFSVAGNGWISPKFTWVET
jgi:hypothetical protein